LFAALELDHTRTGPGLGLRCRAWPALGERDAGLPEAVSCRSTPARARPAGKFVMDSGAAAAGLGNCAGARRAAIVRQRDDAREARASDVLRATGARSATSTASVAPRLSLERAAEYEDA
jgi:hypothetical protein